MRPTIEIDVSWRGGRAWPRAEALLRRVARRAAAAEGFRAGVISIAVVGAGEMARLHRRYMGIDGATDVISFDLCDSQEAGERPARRGRTTPVRGRDVCGEIVVCRDVARGASRARPGGVGRGARAAALRELAIRELALYVVHGVLHLAGYDDGTRGGYERMHRREDELLTEMGLGAVFSA